MQNSMTSAFDASETAELSGAGRSMSAPELNFSSQPGGSQLMAYTQDHVDVMNRVRQYDPIIRRASQTFDVPMEQIRAIIATESRGVPDAGANHGARGLMQVVESSWNDTLKRGWKSGLPQYSFSQWRDPEANIMIGTATFALKRGVVGVPSEHPEAFNIMLACHNAGEGTILWSVQNARNAGERDPYGKWNDARYLKPAIDRAGIWRYYTDRGYASNKSQGIDMKYDEITRFPGKARTYINVQRGGQSQASSSNAPAAQPGPGGLTYPVGRLGEGIEGNKRDQVRWVQQRLIHHGDMQSEKSPGVSSADGIIGDITIQGIERFQFRYVGLPDGRVDPNGTTNRKLAQNKREMPAVPNPGRSGLGGPVGRLEDGVEGNNRFDVRWVQNQLIYHRIMEAQNAQGRSNADGVSGGGTIAAIETFQEANGISVDGRVDPGGSTFKALKKRTINRPIPNSNTVNAGVGGTGRVPSAPQTTNVAVGGTGRITGSTSNSLDGDVGLQDGQMVGSQDDVRRVQAHLIKHGYLPARKPDGRSNRDGILGGGTLSAIQDFQRSIGLSGDQLVSRGGQTWQALAAEVSTPGPYGRGGTSVPASNSSSSTTTNSRPNRPARPSSSSGGNRGISLRGTVGTGNSANHTEDVRKIQQAFLDIGIDVGSADGVAGKITRSAIYQFQAAVGLGPDGVISPGKTTLQKINSMANGAMRISRRDFQNDRNRPVFDTSGFTDAGTLMIDGSGEVVPPQFWDSMKTLIRNMRIIRDHAGHSLNINSGYRSPKHNEKADGKEGSNHQYGMAVDLGAGSMGATALRDLITRLMNQGKITAGGVGFYPGMNFVHYDVRGHYAPWTV